MVEQVDEGLVFCGPEVIGPKIGEKKNFRPFDVLNANISSG